MRRRTFALSYNKLLLEPQSHPVDIDHGATNATSLLDAVLEAADDAIFTKSLAGIITSWGRGAQIMYGYSADEIVGKHVSVLMPGDRKHEAILLLAKTRAGVGVSDFETRRISKSGKILDLVLNITPIRGENGEVIGGLTVARNTRHLLEVVRTVKVLNERERDHMLVLNAAQRVALDILTSQTGIEALRHIADAGRALTGARYAALGVARDDGVPGLQQFVTVGLTHEEEARIGPRPRGLGVLGLLLNRSEPLLIETLSDHPESAGFPPNHPPMNSFLGVPIRSGSSVIGSMYLTDKEGGVPFTDADVLAVEALSGHAAVAIHNLLMLSRQRALVNGLIMAQEEERRAIAYDLHDGLTQYVMASHAHLDSFRKAHAAGSEEKAKRELDTGMKYLKEAVVESRRLVNGLRILALDDLGLAGALEQVIEEEGRRAAWDNTDFVHNIVGRRFEAALETTAYRIAQEALTNVRKHAYTKRVRLTLLYEETPPCLRLEVRDWGSGFDTEQAQNDDSRVGLHSMFERVRNMGGEWSLISAPGEGTMVRAVLPVRPNADYPELKEDHDEW